MNQIPNPDSWMDVATILLVVAMMSIPSWFAARNHKSLTEVRAQVKNAHTSNLRDDVDRAIAGIESLAHDIRGIRSDLLAEEDRRRRDVRDLETQIGKHRKQED